MVLARRRLARPLRVVAELCLVTVGEPQIDAVSLVLGQVQGVLLLVLDDGARRDRYIR